jgi:large-conductance mechanosensitive channel
LNIDKNTPGGAYPVGIRVTYSDTLRNTHEIILNGTVNYTPKTDSSTESGGFLGYGELSSIVIPLVIILAIISILVIIIRRRRRKVGKRNTFNSKSEDLELFDDEFSSSDNKNVGGVKQ